MSQLSAWEKLSVVETDIHVQTSNKGGREFTYLPWHKAWMLCKREYPRATFCYQPSITHHDGTMEVGVAVDFGNSETAHAVLPVMNQSFRAKENPDARDINDARQRCLVKALAFAGLGLNLWSDNFVPAGKQDAPINEKQVKQLTQLIAKAGINDESFLGWLEIESLDELPRERFGQARGMLEQRVAINNESA